MAGLTPSVRLFYIGLWLLADDAGWFRWDTAEVGNELYGYEPRTRRERNVVGHISIPTFTDHQRLSGLTKQVRTEWKEHDTRCIPNLPADPREPPQNPDPVRNGSGKGTGTGTVGNGKERVDAREIETKNGSIDDADLPEYLRAHQ